MLQKGPDAEIFSENIASCLLHHGTSRTFIDYNVVTEANMRELALWAQYEERSCLFVGIAMDARKRNRT